MMKKWLAVGVCVLMLLSLTACGGKGVCDLEPPPAPVDENYEQGMAKLAAGDLTEAYTLLKAATDPKAAEELEHFVFVPTKLTMQQSYSGEDSVTTYTYDERGNLLAETKTGKSNWTTKVDMCHSYIYDKNNRVLTHSYRYGDYRYLETYAYDENGATLSYTYTPVDGETSRSSGYVRTYDARGNLVKEENFDIWDEAYNYTLTYTYDEQDRILTCTNTGYDGEVSVWTYAYDEEGNYHAVHESDEYIQTLYCNKDGKPLKTEVVYNETGEVRELYEYRYDEKGNEVYRRTRYLESETVHTTTYNELGLILTAESSRDGEVYAMSTYTYDQSGNELTHEYFSGSTIWRRETRTYDEQGHLLTWQRMSESGWSNTNYTYDEAGNRIKAEGKGNGSNDTEEYTRDEWGNMLTYRYYGIQNDAESAGVVSIEWQLQYYPDDIPEQVQTVIADATMD